MTFIKQIIFAMLITFAVAQLDVSGLTGGLTGGLPVDTGELTSGLPVVGGGSGGEGGESEAAKAIDRNRLSNRYKNQI